MSQASDITCDINRCLAWDIFLVNLRTVSLIFQKHLNCIKPMYFPDQHLFYKITHVKLKKFKCAYIR